MVKQLIKANTKFKKILEDKIEGRYLNIAECFYDTIQGEGVYAGQPAIFLRMQGCTLNCKFCDSTEVWREGNPYTINELLTMFNDSGIVNRLKKGHHLVLTGGSPLLQQKAILNLLIDFETIYKFKPFIEIENECTLIPLPKLCNYINCWNNSPKLENSGMKENRRYNPIILKYLSLQNNSWFKFVISDINDWKEIEKKFIKTKLIKTSQIILMPEGIDRISINKKYEELVDLCCNKNIRMSDRLHITIWNKKTGV